MDASFQVIMYKIVPIAKSRNRYCTTMKQDKKLNFSTKNLRSENTVYRVTQPRNNFCISNYKV
jgi:hypothetical protein